MSPGATGEGFVAGVPQVNGVDHEDVANVVVAGAGPAGLMLAYVAPIPALWFTVHSLT